VGLFVVVLDSVCIIHRGRWWDWFVLVTFVLWRLSLVVMLLLAFVAGVRAG
jgi:hypothetical protein